MDNCNKFLACIRCFTFNQCSYIREAVNGFVNQSTNFPYLMIVVDDASTDGEIELLHKIEEELFDSSDKSIAYTRETNYAIISYSRCRSNANCYGLFVYLKYNHYSKHISKMPYLKEWRDLCKYEAMCEGDDYWIDTNKLQKQVDYLENNPEYGMCYSQCKYYYQQIGRFGRKPWGGDRVFLKDMIHGNCVPSPTTLYRTYLLDEYHKKIESQHPNWLMGDFPAWLYIASLSKICFMPEVLAVYRVTSNSASHTTQLSKKIAFSLNYIDIMEFYNDNYSIGLSKEHFARLRYISTLRSYALFGDMRSYMRIYFDGCRANHRLLFDMGSYKYLSFIIFPWLRKKRL